jgi:hypothetical protein
MPDDFLPPGSALALTLHSQWCQPADAGHPMGVSPFRHSAYVFSPTYGFYSAERVRHSELVEDEAADIGEWTHAVRRESIVGTSTLRELDARRLSKKA